MNKLVIGTRASKLALAQAESVKKSLTQLDSNLQIGLKEITTRGDRILDKPLAEIDGKGLFLKEIEKYLLEGSIDLAVHSLKDVPVDLPRGLKLAGYPAREDPRDVLVATGCTYLRDLPPGAVVGTGSLRRKAQLLQRRSDLKILPVRGNVNTRLDKLKKGEFQALILAAAGLRRLGLEDLISSYFSPLDFLPAAGQGALAVEIRQGDQRIEELIARLEDEDTAIQVRAERALLSDLGGGCHVPIGCHARIKTDKLELSAMVAAPDGSEYYRQRLQGPKEKYREIARELADKLLEAGAEELLGEDYNYE